MSTRPPPTRDSAAPPSTDGARPPAPRTGAESPRDGARGAWLGLLRASGRALARVPRPLAWLFVLAWSFGMWSLSSRDMDFGPKESFPFRLLGNAAHAPLFGLWALGLALALAPRPTPASWPDPGVLVRRAALVATLLWGLLDEAHQAHTGGRTPSVFDVVTDGVAAACVLAVAAYLGRADADERGVRLRLALGVAACVGAALLASVDW